MGRGRHGAPGARWAGTGAQLRGRVAPLAIVVSFAIVVAACGGGGSGGGSGRVSAAEGETVFKGTCATCHGLDAKGLPGSGKPLPSSKFVAELTDDQLIDFIKTGRPVTDPLNTTGLPMPPKAGNPTLSDNDLADVVAYLRTINKP